MPAKYTNYYGLPKPVFDAISNPSYVKKGDISVTTLIANPLVDILKTNYDYEEDVMENVWSMFGSSIHQWIERITDFKLLESKKDLSLRENEIKTILSSFYQEYKTIRFPIQGTTEQQFKHQFHIDNYQSNILYKKSIERLVSIQTEIKTIDEKISKLDYISEESLLQDFEGWFLSGTPDLIDKANKILDDFKVTSVWKVIKGVSTAISLKDPNFWNDALVDWKLQTNIYRYMHYLKTGEILQEIRIIAILKDFSKTEKMRSKDYPRNPIHIVKIPLISFEEIDEYIKTRVKIHKEARALFQKNKEQNLNPILNIPVCNEKERWAKPAQIAVTKTGRKTALKLCSTPEEATNFIHSQYVNGVEKNGTLFTEERPGSNMKCEEYCSVNRFCPFFQSKYLNNG